MSKGSASRKHLRCRHRHGDGGNPRGSRAAPGALLSIDRNLQRLFQALDRQLGAAGLWSLEAGQQPRKASTAPRGQCMRPAPVRAQHTVCHRTTLSWAARTPTGAGEAGSGGQGFGPRPGVRRREGGHQRRQAGGGGRGPAAAAAAGHNPQPTLEEVEDSGWEGGQQAAEAQASEAEPDPQAEGSSGGADGDMHGQPHYKAGLPSSRSDTMLLQSEEQQRYGLPGGGMGSAGPGLACNAVGQHSMPAVSAAAAAAGATPPSGSRASSNSIPVYVMLPLDTVRIQSSRLVATAAACVCGCAAGCGLPLPGTRAPLAPQQQGGAQHNHMLTAAVSNPSAAHAGQRGRRVPIRIFKVVQCGAAAPGGHRHSRRGGGCVGAFRCCRACQSALLCVP